MIYIPRCRTRPGPEVIKLFSCSIHEILNAHKYKKYQEIQLFSGSDKPRMLFFMFITVKMPTIVGILTFMSRKKFLLNLAKHEKRFITLGPVLVHDNLPVSPLPIT